jgi:transposase
LCVLEELGAHIKAFERHPIGPITSLAFVLAIKDPDRFANTPRDAGAILGLVPRRDQSGDSDKAQPINKSHNTYLRKLLVQRAQYLLGHFGPDCALRRQGLKLADKGSKAAKRKAIIADDSERMTAFS